MGENTLEVNGYHQLFVDIFLSIFFCVEQKKETYASLEQLMGESIMMTVSFYLK